MSGLRESGSERGIERKRGGEKVQKELFHRTFIFIINNSHVSICRVVYNVYAWRIQKKILLVFHFVLMLHYHVSECDLRASSSQKYHEICVHCVQLESSSISVNFLLECMPIGYAKWWRYILLPSVSLLYRSLNSSFLFCPLWITRDYTERSTICPISQEQTISTKSDF